MLFNQFTDMPFIPYKIFNALVDNDNLFKLLYYGDYDALSKPNLTIEQKMDMLWQGQPKMDNFNVFLTAVVPDLEIKAKTILKCYKYSTVPDNPIMATLNYRFDVLYGSTIPLVEYQGMTCNRGDLIEMELMKSLNGKDVAGVGYLQYNRELSRSCNTLIGIGNNYTYTGVSIVMATQMASIDEGDCYERY